MKHIIFDFDGTIINTNDLIISTLRKVAKEKLNRELDDQDIRNMFGLTIDEQMKILDPTVHNELANYYLNIYSKELESKTELFEGIEELLAVLKEQNYNLFILTNNNTKDTIYSMKRFNIFKYFDCIVTMDDVKVGKPDSEGLELLFENNNLNKEASLLIGDSPHDIEAGIEFGIKTILVGWSMFKEKDFKVKPDLIINKPKELLSVL